MLFPSMSDKIYIRKSEFLKIVYKIYKHTDLEKILILSQALMIIYNQLSKGDEDFDSYEGFIEI